MRVPRHTLHQTTISVVACLSSGFQTRLFGCNPDIWHRFDIGEYRNLVFSSHSQNKTSLPVPRKPYKMVTMDGAANGHARPIDVLLIGLGSIGSVYAYILEKVSPSTIQSQQDIIRLNDELTSAQTGRARVTAVVRSNHSLYSTTGVTLNTEKFGKIEGWQPYRGDSPNGLRSGQLS